MRRHALDVSILFVIATGLCAYIAFGVPAERTLALRIYLLFLGALLMLVVVSAVNAAAPRVRRSDLTAALDERPAPAGPVSQLVKIEREVTLSIGNAYDLHTRLLPHLREIAFARLERRGQRPGPDTLGRWWELLRPDRPEPSDRFGPGIPERELRELVADLEAI
jgi:hypothetical protein